MKTSVKSIAFNLMAISLIFVLCNWSFYSNFNGSDYVKSVKNDFETKDLSTKLITPFDKNLNIVWKPLWDKGSTSTTGLFIPLAPALKEETQTIQNAAFELQNTKRFLHVESSDNGYSYSLKTYIIEEDNHQFDDQNLEDYFSGTLLTKNLITDKATFGIYKNGVELPKNPAWVCVYWKVCHWRGLGGDHPCPSYVTNTSQRGPQPNYYDCPYPGGPGCGQYDLYSTYVEQYCE